jgi:signal transduction histidine kinase
MELFKRFKTQVVLGITLFAMLILTTNLFIYKNSKETRDLADQLNTLRRPATEASQGMETAIYKALFTLRGWLLLRENKFQVRNEEAWKVILHSKKEMDRLSEYWANPQNSFRLKKMAPLLEKFRSAQLNIFKIYKFNKKAAISILETEAIPTAKSLLIILTKMVEEHKKLHRLDIIDMSRNTNIFFDYLKVFIPSIFFLILVFTWYTLKTVIDPISEAMKATQRISEMDLETKITLKGPIEIKSLGEGLDKMRNNLRKNRKRLENANEELLQFSYRTSHDLKSPLTTTKRLASCVIEDIDSGDTEEAQRNVNKIYNQMEKLENLVIDILALAKADLNEEKKQKVNFFEVIKEMKERLGSLINESKCNVTESIDLSGDVFFEKARFSQLLDNLVSNGIKYRDNKKANPYVKINITDTLETLFITVEDNGMGIPERHQAEVFRVFKRFHPDAASGSGIGMTIVKKHVDHLNGKIGFSSSSQGTKFKIEIPKNLEKTRGAA